MENNNSKSKKDLLKEINDILKELVSAPNGTVMPYKPYTRFGPDKHLYLLNVQKLLEKVVELNESIDEDYSMIIHNLQTTINSKEVANLKFEDDTKKHPGLMRKANYQIINLDMRSIVSSIEKLGIN